MAIDGLRATVLAILLTSAAALPVEAQTYKVPAVVSGVTGGPTFSPRFRYDAVQDAVVYSRADDSNDWGTDTEPTITLSSNNRGSKTVTRIGGVGDMGVAVDGYILSPSEPRILVVVSEWTPGFEGQEEGLTFYGAHLSVGFRK